MDHLIQQIAELSPEEREQLSLLLQQKGAEYGIFPLSSSQKRLWFLDQWEPSNSAYNMPIALHFSGSLDIAILQKCLQHLIQRHEALRTIFVLIEKQPWQVILPFESLDWQLALRDVSSSALDEPEPIQQLLKEEACRPFELHKGPLIRATLFRIHQTKHILLLTMHHIISDGWSMNIFFNEFSTLYRTYQVGKAPELAELTLQYADFAVWQQQWLHSPMYAKQLAYWQEQLAQCTQELVLPTSKQTASSYAAPNATVLFTIPPSMTNALTRLSHQEGATLFMLLLSAFKVLLYRYTQQQDLLVGTPIANRNRKEIEHVIGFFVNMLAIRTHLSDECSFTELLKQVRTVTLAAYEHQDLPFERLVEALQPARNPDKHPLFQVTFILQNEPMKIAQLPGLTIDLQTVERGAMQFDLSLELTMKDEGLQGCLEYKTELFDEATILRMADHFQQLLESICEHPEAQIGRLNLLTTEERHQLLYAWNTTSREYPKHVCLHTLFEAQVRKTPDAPAILAEKKQVSYAELNRQANQLAHYLRSLPIQLEMPIGLCLERSPSVIAAILGILKAGGAYVPLDPAYPEERLTFIAKDAGITLLLTQSSLVHKFNGLDLDILCLDEPQPMPSANTANPELPLSAENLAYIIYTSGSTGHPKGVSGTHRGAVNRYFWMRNAYPFASTEVCCQKTSLSFVDSIWEIFGPLLAGIPTVIIPDAVVKDPYLLVNMLARQRVTRIVLVPSLLRSILQAHADIQQKLPLLRYWTVSGEALPLELLHQFQQQLPHSILLNLYGSSEVAADATCFEIAGGERLSYVPIGRPLNNTQVYLLDRFFQPVPVNIPGEVYVSGEGLARGYHRQPHLTAERFLANPFAEAGSRMYKTGDLARYRHDGILEFLGRNDRQVKIRGIRIELGEIEAALSRFPTVQEVAVIACEDTQKMSSLVAYVVQKAPANSLRHLETALKRLLPEYMLPSRFIEMEKLPRMANGKIDRRALPVPDAPLKRRENRFEAPRTPLEKLLADIWRTTLNIQEIGIDDNFFESGGHSMLATTMILRIREQLKVNVTLHNLFEAPTVAQLAQLIEHAHLETLQASAAQLPDLVPDPHHRFHPFPLTDTQQAYLVGRTNIFDLGGVATHGYIELESTLLDLPRFTRAWQAVIDRHDMLRAVILPDGQQQVLSQVPPYIIPLLDLREMDVQESTRQAEAVRQHMSHQVLPADQWPLFDLCAIRFDDQRIRLCISIDGLICDNRSWQVLYDELAMFYEHGPIYLPPLELSFHDYVRAEMQLKETELYRQSVSYWQQRLPALAPAPELPLLRNDQPVFSPQFKRRQAILESEQWEQIKAFASHTNLTPSIILLTAYAEVLATWSKTPRFTINIPRVNRLPLHPQVTKMVGEFASFLLLEIDCTPSHSFASRAQQIQEQLWRDLNHQYVSGVEMLRELRRTQGRYDEALMPVVFTSMLGWDDFRQNILDEICTEVHSITQTPQVWLDLQVVEREGALSFNWDAVDALFPEGVLDDMFAAYCRLLHWLTIPSNWNRAVPLLTPPDQLQQRERVNATEAPIPETLLHLPFMEQADAHPHQIALITSQKSFTYREVAQQANRIAHWLRHQGVRANTLVAIVMEKGWEQIVAAYGILNAGAAYLPIDATLPQERMWHILAQARVRIVLTQPHLHTTRAWPHHVEVHSLEAHSFEDWDDRPLAPIQQADDLAYVIFTSGTTGLPKGAMIAHRGIVNCIHQTNKTFSVTPKDRILSLTALHHDMSVYDIFGILAMGGTLVLPDANKIKDPAHWHTMMQHHAVTVWNSVPAMMEMFLLYLEQIKHNEVHSLPLRLAFLGGDWIPLSMPSHLQSLFPDIQVVSVGGPTETTLWNIWYPIPALSSPWKSVPYGKPIANTRYYVLDQALRPRPTWVVGELYCSGVGLAKGYWCDEEQTRASFLIHPDTGERLYRTGDLGRYLPDGTLEFSGRSDSQVKIHGHRIELGEIEVHLQQHPAVRSAIVTTYQSGKQTSGPDLVAYVMLEHAATEPPSDAQQLPQSLTADLFEGIEDADSIHLRTRLERAEFKLKQIALRHEQSAQDVQLLKPINDDAFYHRYRKRRSYRNFLPEPIAFEQFNAFLNSLYQTEMDGLYKYLYPSAGGLYPLQIYFYIKPSRIAGLSEGIYYYHPRDHRLVAITVPASMQATIHASHNQALFTEAAFSLFLIAQLAAIEPMYGKHARDFCLLDAGYLGYHLMNSALPHQMGLCPIGNLDFESIRHLFALQESHLIIHTLLGGKIAPSAQAGEYNPQKESEVLRSYSMADELRNFLREKLPSYMVPTLIIPVPNFPHTPNGKIDRKALPDPSQFLSGQRPDEQKTRQTPATHPITQLVADILHVEHVDHRSSLFEIGANSLDIVKILNAIEKQIKFRPPIAEFLRHPTIAHLIDIYDLHQKEQATENTMSFTIEREEGEL